MEKPITSDAPTSRWIIIRRHVNSGTLQKEYAKITSKLMENDLKKRDYIMDIISEPEVLRRLSLQEDSNTQLALQEFVTEMMGTLSDINNRNRTDSIKKLRGIIKKTLNCEMESTKPKNSVHFSEENIYIEIPRRTKHKFNIITEKCTYYCCFGFLFPV